MAVTKTADALQQHVVGTYRHLRRGLTILGLAFPILLVVIGYAWYGVTPQPSMSAYYHAEAPTPAAGRTRRRASQRGARRFPHSGGALPRPV